MYIYVDRSRENQISNSCLLLKYTNLLMSFQVLRTRDSYAADVLEYHYTDNFNINLLNIYIYKDYIIKNATPLPKIASARNMYKSRELPSL